jgi:Phage tail tube protein
MATCAINKIDSNVTSLNIAEEECYGVLPSVVSGDQAAGEWYNLEANSYSDFGAKISTVARSPINPSRQNKKGVTTDLEASGGFNVDFTKTNLNRLLQGFFFADARQKVTTDRFNLATIQVASTTTSTYATASALGLIAFNLPDTLLFAEGFDTALNNGLKTIVSANTTSVTVADTLSVESSVNPKAKLTAVGFKFASGDANLTFNAGVVSLTAVAKNMTTFGFIPGEWVFIGGDNVLNRFNSFSGYARIKSISSTSITFDDISIPVTSSDLGIGKSIHIYFGHVIKNENDPLLIKRRSYQMERQLGLGANGVQAEYLEGAVANEFSLKISTNAKIEVDLKYVAANASFRSGDPGDVLKLGARFPSNAEEAFNTSNNVARTKISLVSNTVTYQPPLLNFVSEASFDIANGVAGLKAIGVLGSFDTTVGNFEVKGSLTGMFATVAAPKAVRDNADAGFSTIIAAKNGGWIFDMPLVGLGGGELKVDKDKEITISIEESAAENKNGYTALYNFFSYLPTVAMPK